MSRPATLDNALGAYLKDRRTKLDPAAFGLSGTRRRTPGLRRGGVAQRAHISVTWYTWLERRPGGPPSAEVLNRIASALMLTDAEREHLFLLGLGRPPEARYQEARGISPRLQRVLDALPHSAAYIKTLTWDLVAWNRAAAAVFNYDELEPSQRNILRRMFCDPRVRDLQFDWESVARFVVSAFRADAARASAGNAAQNIEALVNELCHCSSDFARLWGTHEVHAFGEGTKQMRHPIAGTISLEYSAFAVDGRPDLGMVVYNPATPTDLRVVLSLIKRHQKASH